MTIKKIKEKKRADTTITELYIYISPAAKELVHTKGTFNSKTIGATVML